MTEHTPAPWVSEALMDPRLIMPFRALGFRDLPQADRDYLLDAMRRSQEGELLLADRFPTVLYCTDTAHGFRHNLPDLCMAGSFWVVSAALKDVLQSFDVGRTNFPSVSVLECDKTTPLEGRYFYFNLGEYKQSFLPEQSRVRPFNPDRGIWSLRLAAQDEDVTVSTVALEGADLWLEVPRLRKTFLVSDRLATALRESKLNETVRLRRCRVIR